MKRPRGQKYKWQPKIRITTIDNYQGAKLIIISRGVNISAKIGPSKQLNLQMHAERCQGSSKLKSV
jgi:hypothetical protein